MNTNMNNINITNNINTTNNTEILDVDKLVRMLERFHKKNVYLTR